MIRPRFRTGANTPERVATTTAASPDADAPPFLRAFGIVKRRMQNRHALAEALVELAGDGGRQPDLRHQHQRAAAQRQRGFDGVQDTLRSCRIRSRLATETSEIVARRAPRGCNRTPPAGADSAHAAREAAACDARPPLRASAVPVRAAPARARRCWLWQRISPAPQGCAGRDAVPDRTAARAPASEVSPSARATNSTRSRAADARRGSRSAATSSDFDESLLFERPQHGRGFRSLFVRDTTPRAGARPACAGCQRPDPRSVSVQVQLPRCVATRFRERINSSAPDSPASGVMARKVSPSGAQ